MKHVIGIDLGTTHSALAHAPLDPEGTRAEILPIAQLVAQGTVESCPLLPSFVYFAHKSEGPQVLPWTQTRTFAVGEHARSRGADAPARVIASSKSWLCHSGVDRRKSILPSGAPEDIEKISPVEASRRLLEHLGEAWDTQFPDAPFGEQDVILTVPASFDPSARELTVEAALAAGIQKPTLLEEPQAALYAWIDCLGDRWRKELKAGDVVLVVDVGGGTTDFSAIAAVAQEGALALHRIAVGEHILLGGDNMDLALAHLVRQKLEASGKELDRWQLVALTHACRGAKERLLTEASLQTAPIALVGRGSKLIGGGLRSELSRDEITQVLVEGFFPAVDASARPVARSRSALMQLGLPYAADPGITRHLAAFLGRQADATRRLEGFAAPASQWTLLHPTAVLFNGGVMKGDPLRQRLLDTLDTWLEADGAPRVRVLAGSDFDLAVARGAASYALARRGRGIRIRGGTARAYYVGIEGAVPAVPGMEPPMEALCVAPFGMEEGTEAQLPPDELGVVIGEPVRFRFFGSSVRRDDTVGTKLFRWKAGELEELAPIEVTLPAETRQQGEVVPAHLRASVTEVGTLLLEAVPLAPKVPGECWKVELSVRSEE
ncbi:MAG: Hsp70 family protein [Myxococcales bacterium]